MRKLCCDFCSNFWILRLPMSAPSHFGWHSPLAHTPWRVEHFLSAHTHTHTHPLPYECVFKKGKSLHMKSYWEILSPAVMLIIWWHKRANSDNVRCKILLSTNTATHTATLWHTPTDFYTHSGTIQVQMWNKNRYSKRWVGFELEMRLAISINPIKYI